MYKEFNLESLLAFNWDYFHTGKYSNLRYGQALCNVFNFDVLFETNLYYEEDIILCTETAFGVLYLVM